MIRYSEQLIDTDDIDGVAEVLQSKYLTQGPLINEFENLLSRVHTVEITIRCKELGSYHL